MGAALTYARRYGLFTLVGIAGDDDLDAPDLLLQVGPAAQPEPAAPIASPPLAPALHRINGRSKPPKPIATLDTEASTRQRDELLGELAAIASFDAAAAWAKRILPVKNTLTADHAREIEVALEVKLGQIGDPFGEPPRLTTDPPCSGGQTQPQQSDDAALGHCGPQHVDNRSHATSS